ncbi:pyrroline-5-carboxylate reductase [Segetibacter sp. 3557_3]|uniref:pyrroline-5-carboxylate reductase n=1 Tax=Segetibacter sp. 3557_3 TaxID=2547429 RepID=UPI001404B66D|nr:pyrroline-5-carboxylate reductase [Segetibacter sp. 3557_3]
MKKIAIIGGGNLGTAIAEGLISNGFAAPEHIMVTKRNVSTVRSLQDSGVVVSSDNNAAVRFADVVILAVKPFQVKDVVANISSEFVQGKHCLVSVVTGVLISEIQELIPETIPIFRAMPNTAIAIRQSMTCICHSNANVELVNYIREMFDQLGRSVTIEEKLMDASTVLGACGTAFAMRYIRANIQGGIEIGFDANTASLIAAQTVKGAAELLLQRHTHPEQEIDKVTTPKGCTIAGLNEMEHMGFSSSLIKGIVASYRKIGE